MSEDSELFSCNGNNLNRFGRSILCDNDNCVECFEKSFASHKYANRWSSKNPKTPRQTFKGSTHLAWFNCNICNHEYRNRISRANCSYCGNRKLCDDNDCKICFEKSFASHPKAKLWSKSKNKITPRQIFKVTGTKHVFKCPYCMKYYTSKISNIINGKWCNCRINKTESKLFKYFKKHYPNIQKQVKFDWCKNIRHLPFDFYIPEYNLLIELDGEHHFNSVGHWPKKLHEIQERDIMKMKLANEYKLSVIRIDQRDVWCNKNNWKNKLNNSIEQVKNNNNVQNILIGEVYNNHLCYKLCVELEN